MSVRHISFIFFRYRARHAPGAFMLMGFQRLFIEQHPSARVALMGCGSRDGFSIVPDFLTYCLVCRLDDPGALEDVKRSRLYRLVSGPAIETLHFALVPISGHGTWGGEAPFDYQGRQDPDRPFVVLTRAQVRPARARDFWRDVPKVRQSLKAHSGCRFAQGFGEHPLLSLATFSVWEGLEPMREFAYRHSPHHRTAQSAMRDHWLSESLFARFAVERIEGDLHHYPALAGLADA